MAQFTITVPDELAAGFVADMYASNEGRPDPFQSVEDYVQFSAIALATDRCKAHSVGPDYVGPVLVAAKYNQDGTPVVQPAVEVNEFPLAEEGV